MTGPEQVSVNVADMSQWLIEEGLAEERGGYGHASGEKVAERLLSVWDVRLRAAIPEPEWEPTDDMRAKGRQVLQHLDLCEPLTADRLLRALHREELIP